MRIGFVCSEYPPSRHGGIGSATAVLARSLAARGHWVWVGGVYSDPVPPELQRQDDQGVEVVRMQCPAGRGGWLRGRHRLFTTISRMMRRRELDLVEVPDWEGQAACWPKLPGPVVTRLNGSATYFARELGQPVSWIHRYLESSSFRRSDFWCSASRYTAEQTEKVFGAHGRPPAVLFNPVEIPEQSVAAPERDRNRVVFAGTLTPKKGVISLVRAWPAIVRAVPSAELHLFGKDAGTDDRQPMFPYLLNQLDDPGLRNTITWHGGVPREQVKQEFRSARVAVFPSYSEAFGVVPMEAMSERCPVVYTTRSSGPELITDQVNGLLIDPDDHGAISRAVLRVLRDDTLAAGMGQAGYEHVASSFSTEALVPRNEAFFQESIHEFRRGRG